MDVETEAPIEEVEASDADVEADDEQFALARTPTNNPTQCS